MRIIGLTGSIGMGKSVLASQWRSIGVPVYDADKNVHELMQPNGLAFNAVTKLFPSVIENGKINRKKLGEIVFNDKEKLKSLEAIIHPLTYKSSKDFIKKCRQNRKKICVLDIPLLFELGRENTVNEILCVTAPAYTQQRRVLSRPNMTHDKFKSIVRSQIPDYRKRILSDHVVITARGKRHTLNQIKRIKNNEQ